MFAGFRCFDIRTSDTEVAIRGVIGGAGPPLLLLHGNPLDRQDLEAERTITCLVLVVVGGQSHTTRFYRYEQAWATYASNLVGCVALPCGHYPAEQAPDETYATLCKFFRG